MTIAEFIKKYDIRMEGAGKRDSVMLTRYKSPDYRARFTATHIGPLYTKQPDLEWVLGRVVANIQTNMTNTNHVYRRKVWRWLGGMEAFNELMGVEK